MAQMSTIKNMLTLVGVIITLLVCGVASQDYTPIHAPGYCIWYGECGETGDPAIPGDLNCPNNTEAVPFPSNAFKQQLVDFCGPRWNDYTAVCCDADMLSSLISSIDVAKQLVSGCPACWQNFIDFYCEMTCSPDGSTFLNVTKVGPDPAGGGKDVVLEIQYYVDPEFGVGYYDSCAEVTFSMSNSPAMLLIGGGATNYQDFFEFMGTSQFQGTPFQINFPLPETHNLSIYTPMNVPVRHCYDTDPSVQCTCVDCSQSCAVPPDPEESAEACYVGQLRCLPFGLIILWVVLVIVAAAVYLAARLRSDKSVLDEDTEYTKINDSSLETAEAPASEWKVYSTLQSMYYRLGYKVARHPCAVLLLSILFVEACALGLLNFRVITDPVELWSDEQSTTRLQKNYFDETFGPFYRTQQLILSPLDKSQNAIQKNYFELLFEIEAGVANLTVNVAGADYNLDNLCFKPLGEAFGCVVYSITGYWQNDANVFDNPELNPLGWQEHFRICTSNPSFPGDTTSQIGCLPPFQEPIKPELVLGGYTDIEYTNATALVITWVINNSLDETYLDGVVEWEELLVAYLKNVSDTHSDEMRITYYTESGVELELARESASDLVTIAISYLVMLLYVSVALGRFSSWRRVLVDTKFFLGVAGVFICICSVVVAIGLFSMFGVGTSLIIAEVIPFLVLAVGVDNIFILVNEFDRLDKSLPVEERAALALSEVGPSITLSAVSETVAFSLGSIVTMPAVNSFAGFSAVAIFVDFLLQITCFLTLMAADARRAESKRVDCVPCVKLDVEATVDRENTDGFLKHFIRHYYSPFLLHPFTKLVVVLFFSLLLIVGISFIPYVELGLDQTIALPQDSYLLPYFADQSTLLKVGVPVYFVISGGNATTLEGKKQLCAAYRDCDINSVANQLVLESKRPEYSTLALRPSTWIDDYLAWANPSNRKCCRTLRSDETSFCQAQTDPYNFRCQTCYTADEYNAFDLGPSGSEFMRTLDFWLQAIPSTECVRAGQGAYSTAIALNLEEITVTASHFRTYHTVIQTQAEYINAYDQALRICTGITDTWPDLQCFPYTIFYVYFEQYQTIIGTTFLVLSMAAVAVFLVTWLILGSLVAALWVVAVVLMVVIDLAGVMAVWRISLNAISLVNLAVGLGISVEFCSHITRAFTLTQGTKNERAHRALVDVGASVFSGVTLTKFAGVVVLAFAQSQIFVVYYFRMYLSIVVLGFGHGLVLLPVLLSFWGPRSILAVSSEKVAIASMGDKEFKNNEQRKLLYS